MPKSAPSFSLGGPSYRVPMSMHAGNRTRLLERLRALAIPRKSLVLLQGGATQHEYDTDNELLFRQESFFQYLFGVKEPGFFGAIELDTCRAMLFAPRLPADWAVWMGQIHSPAHFRESYAVDDCFYVDELPSRIAAYGPEKIWLLSGKNSDSGLPAQPATFPGIEAFKTDTEVLHPELVECRVHKSAEEIELLRWINQVASAAHIAVMRACRPGMSEYQLEALFLHEIYAKGGCRFTPYTSICGCGPHSAVLHYGHQGAPNDGVLVDGDLFLDDSGAEYHGYASDITCSYPVSGKFSTEQRRIYEAVLAANLAVQRTMKPGVRWPEMHRLAERVIAEHLIGMGILRGSLADVLAAHLPAIFMPHGLGHLMGLDTHDVGGYPAGIVRIDEPGIRHLRCGRALEEGMVITVEPGIYFIDLLIDRALAEPRQAALIDAEKLERFRGFGGVRIEDDVLVTANGAENLTRVPRTVEDIERTMAEGRTGKPLKVAVTA